MGNAPSSSFPVEDLFNNDYVNAQVGGQAGNWMVARLPNMSGDGLIRGTYGPVSQDAFWGGYPEESLRYGPMPAGQDGADHLLEYPTGFLSDMGHLFSWH